MEVQSIIRQQEYQGREHGAWLDIMAELRKLGVEPNGSGADALARALRKWGEELHQLRLGSRNAAQAKQALVDVRSCYEGQWERGTYPESSR